LFRSIGVASNQELKTVRDLGFTGQLMRVRSATLKEMQQAIAYDVEELIGDKTVAEQLNNIAKLNGKVLRIHLALNS
ncbi:alanine racemase, partial [Yersinia wautersii]|uniref:alanine racemase n=1 Tax=Yersinia wautersii TaxID=1341643 RepID=UPI00053B3B99